jgi:hypothetical protein
MTFQFGTNCALSVAWRHCSGGPGLPPNESAYADACGDVWSSPAPDESFTDPARPEHLPGIGLSAARLVPQAGHRHRQGRQGRARGVRDRQLRGQPLPGHRRGSDYVDNQSVFALDPVTGTRVWNFVGPYNAYDNNPQEPGGGDDDFGSSPVITAVPSSDVPAPACPSSAGSTSLVIEGSKDGYAYGLCEASGGTVWSHQIAQPGQLDQAAVGSIGGFIASPSLGAVKGKAALFFAAAIPPWCRPVVRRRHRRQRRLPRRGYLRQHHQRGGSPSASHRCLGLQRRAGRERDACSVAAVTLLEC